jgi:DNA polymerase
MIEHIIELQKRCYDCCDCSLGSKKVEGEDPHVFAHGRADADIMFIGEAPGRDEVIKRIPLVGRAGNFFNTRILGGAGLEREEVYVTNAVLCRPDNNRTPHFHELEACKKHLDAQVMLISPKLLVTMGNAPLYSTCGTQGITKEREIGMRLSNAWSDGRKIPVLPLFHPAYCLRGSGLKEMGYDVSVLRAVVEKIKEKGA